MKIKVVGLFLTIVLAVLMVVFVSFGFGDWLLASPNPATVVTRFILPENIIVLIQSLSNMIWHYRGIDMVLQGVFLFVAALAASVFFYGADKEE